MNLPCKSCKAECCYSPALTGSEYDALKAKYPSAPLRKEHLFGLGTLHYVGPIGKPCWFLKGNRCSIYEDRPDVCKRFGTVKELPCPKMPLNEMPSALLRKK